MPSEGNLTWHPPFSGEIFLLSALQNIHVYNFPFSSIFYYGILEYNKKEEMYHG